MALIDDSSILMSIKRLLNIDPEEMAFDTEIGMFINGEFMTLHQLGIGPEEGFAIHEADTRWTDFSDDQTLIETVKTYMYLRVRLLFDPPGSSIVSDAINSRINELQFRLTCQAERNYIDEEEIEEEEQSGNSNGNSHCDCADRKIYEIQGENLTLFQTPMKPNSEEGD